MLVLSRFVGESILIGDPKSPDCIRVTLVEIRTGEKVRIGIDTPPHVQVLRDELVEDSDT